MSWDALKIAAQSRCRTPTAKLVLIMLANYADENYSSYPSNSKLSDLCGCDERTIKRAIKTLVEDGLVRVTPRFSKDGKQTSNSFTIITNRGDKNDGVGVTKMTPNTVRDIPVIKESKRGDKNVYPKEFLDWWDLYPRSDGSKKKAFEAWVKAQPLIDQDDLVTATKMFARSCHGKDKTFIAHATTWLNQRRWETVQEAQAITTNRNQLAG